MNRLAIVSLIGLPIAAATAIVPASASTGVHARAIAVHGALVHPDQPNSNIVGQGSTAKYNPKTLTIAEDTSGANCTTGFISLTITNTGTKKAFVTIDKAPFFTAPPGTMWDICFYGGGAGATAKIGLSNKTGTIFYKGHLKITTSD